MEVLEKDAGTLWCSEVQIILTGDTDTATWITTNRGHTYKLGDDPSTIFSCLGKRCAVWAWTNEEQTRGECGLKRA